MVFDTSDIIIVAYSYMKVSQLFNHILLDQCWILKHKDILREI